MNLVFVTKRGRHVHFGVTAQHGNPLTQGLIIVLKLVVTQDITPLFWVLPGARLIFMSYAFAVIAYYCRLCADRSNINRNPPLIVATWPPLAEKSGLAKSSRVTSKINYRNYPQTCKRSSKLCANFWLFANSRVASAQSSPFVPPLAVPT